MAHAAPIIVQAGSANLVQPKATNERAWVRIRTQPTTAVHRVKKQFARAIVANTASVRASALQASALDRQALTIMCAVNRPQHFAGVATYSSTTSRRAASHVASTLMRAHWISNHVARRHNGTKRMQSSLSATDALPTKIASWDRVAQSATLLRMARG